MVISVRVKIWIILISSLLILFSNPSFASKNPRSPIGIAAEAVKTGIKTVVKATTRVVKKVFNNIGDFFKGFLGKKSKKALILKKNKIMGDKFESKTLAKKKKEFLKAEPQITVKTKAGVKTKLDIMTKDKKGNIGCIECKSSKTASFSKNQKASFPEINKTGGVIVGKGKPGFEGGTIVPPTEVEVIRP